MMDFIEIIAGNIKEHGWHGQCSTRNGSPFNYSIGMTEKGLPELLVIGLPPEIGHAIIREAIDHMKDHAPADGEIDNEIANLPSVYREVPADQAAKHYTCWVENYYRRPGRVMQIVWPDKAGKFPWEKECDPRMARIQCGVIDWTKMN